MNWRTYWRRSAGDVLPVELESRSFAPKAAPRPGRRPPRRKKAVRN